VDCDISDHCLIAFQIKGERGEVLVNGIKSKSFLDYNKLNNYFATTPSSCDSSDVDVYYEFFCKYMQEGLQLSTFTRSYSDGVKQQEPWITAEYLDLVKKLILPLKILKC